MGLLKRRIKLKDYDFGVGVFKGWESVFIIGGKSWALFKEVDLEDV